MSTQRPEAQTGPQRAGDAAARLSQDTAELVRQELAEVGSQLTATVRRAGLGAVLVAGSGLCGLLTLWAAHETALRALEHLMPRDWAAASLTAAYASGAGALAVLGWDRLRAAARESGEAIGQVRQDLPVLPADQAPTPHREPGAGPVRLSRSPVRADHGLGVRGRVAPEPKIPAGPERRPPSDCGTTPLCPAGTMTPGRRSARRPRPSARRCCCSDC